jgi:non-ribosomal peptide synthetase component F
MDRHRTCDPLFHASEAVHRPGRQELRRIAVVFGKNSLTYGELDARANQLAHHLRDLGVGLETVAGLCVERSPEIIIGLLRILKAGGADLPLDPDYPHERLAFMLVDAGAPVLVTQSALLDRLPCMAPGSCGSMPTGRLSRSIPTTAPTVALDPHNTACVIYRSGSTGEPKGVAVTHAGIPNLAAVLVDWLTVPDTPVCSVKLLCSDLGDFRWPNIGCRTSEHR